MTNSAERPGFYSSGKSRPGFHSSDTFYLTGGGGCRKVTIGPDGRMTEFPYELDEATVCSREGPHPHGPLRTSEPPKVDYNSTKFLSPDHIPLLSRARWLEEEVKRLREIKSQPRTMVCGYCGVDTFRHQGPNPPSNETVAEMILVGREHTKVCTQNPLVVEIGQLKREIASLRAKLRELN